MVYNIITTNIATYLEIEVEGNAENIELSKWVCDKIHDTLRIRGAFGEWVMSAKDDIQVDGLAETDLSVIRAAVGANW